MFHILTRYIFLKGVPQALKVSAAITVIGIAVAVAVLIISLSVAGGFEREYKRSILDFNAHIILLNEGGDFGGYEDLMKNLSTFEGIVATTPFVFRETMVVSKGVVKGIVIKGVDFSTLPLVSNISITKFPTGDLTILPSYHLTVFLGKALAEKLGVNAPTEVNLMLGSREFKKVLVAGTFESGLYDYDSQFALMGLKDLQGLFKMSDRVSGIEMKAADPDDAPMLAEVIKGELSFPFTITHWGELNQPIFEAMHLEKIMFAIIIGVLVLVSIFNIIGALVLRIIYKRKDIAVLAAIGMRGGSIKKIFTFHGTAFGVTGVLLGIVLGIAGAIAIGRLKLVHIEPEIYFLSSLPIKIETLFVILIAVIGILVSLFVSFLASNKITGLNLIESLKETM